MTMTKEEREDLKRKALAANHAIPGPWQHSIRNWRNEEAEPNQYITGNHTDGTDYDDEEGDENEAGPSCVSVAMIQGNASSGDIPKVIAEHITSFCPFNALRYLAALEAAEKRAEDATGKAQSYENQLVWLSAWCERALDVRTNAVIGRDGWPCEVAQVVARAVDTEMGRLRQRAEAAERELSRRCLCEFDGGVMEIECSLHLARRMNAEAENSRLQSLLDEIRDHDPANCSCKSAAECVSVIWGIAVRAGESK